MDDPLPYYDRQTGISDLNWKSANNFLKRFQIRVRFFPNVVVKEVRHYALHSASAVKNKSYNCKSFSLLSFLCDSILNLGR